MYDEFEDKAQFLLIYIREAHPSDEWQTDSNVDQGVVLAQPTTFDERRQVAQSCSTALSLSMTCLVDDMNDTADKAYAAWPERLFVIDTHGTIAYAGAQGPFGFEPDHVAQWLRDNVK